MKATKKEIQDLYFMDARHKLLDIAAYLDRVDRHTGEADYRHPAFLKALHDMTSPPEGLTRTESVHHAFSDHSTTPLKTATTQTANGAVNPDESSL